MSGPVPPAGTAAGTLHWLKLDGGGNPVAAEWMHDHWVLNHTNFYPGSMKGWTYHGHAWPPRDAPHEPEAETVEQLARTIYAAIGANIPDWDAATGYAISQGDEYTHAQMVAWKAARAAIAAMPPADLSAGRKAGLIEARDIAASVSSMFPACGVAVAAINAHIATQFPESEGK